MKLISKVAFSLVLVCVSSTTIRSYACAPSSCAPAPPDECASTRDQKAFSTGVATGVSLVDQIWKSNAIGENPANWGTLKEQVDDTIPATIASMPGWPYSYDSYIRCRAQGLLDGSTCRMGELNPFHGCAVHGIDWGIMCAHLYCQFSTTFGGLVNVVPWFIRKPIGISPFFFQAACYDVFRFIATDGAHELGSYDDFCWTPPPHWPPRGLPACAPFTQPPFSDIFEDSAALGCSYDGG